MLAKQEYDSYVDRLNSATVAVFVLAAAVFLFTPAVAQINGTPASVTSANFGGRFTSTPGVPASITSLGPSGIQAGSALFPPACCIKPLFPVNPNPPLFQRHHHHQQNSFFPAGGAVYVPYPVPVEADADDMVVQPNPADDDRGGPTIFDRRGSGQPARRFLDDYPPRPRVQSESRDQSDRESATSGPPAEAPVPDQPQTVLIFKDGHQVEVQNYAVVGSMLYDLTPGHHRKIAVADLDLKATAKQNDDLGISFQLPSAPNANKEPDANK